MCQAILADSRKEAALVRNAQPHRFGFPVSFETHFRRPSLWPQPRESIPASAAVAERCAADR
jgi:hypothetical protein